MSIQLHNRRITLFGDSVEYDPYYFAIATEENGSEDKWNNYRVIVQSVLGQWAAALARDEAVEKVLYLPFGIDDECVECFAGTVDEDLVTLRIVRLNVNGYTLNLLDLHDFMTTAHEVTGQSPENFGVYDRTKFIRGLAEAEWTGERYND